MSATPLIELSIIAGVSVITGAVALRAWLWYMRKLREANFEGGVRKDNKRKLSDRPDLLSQQIEYHNKATYRALEFYVKVLLAVLGGVAYIVLNRPLKTETGRCLFTQRDGLFS